MTSPEKPPTKKVDTTEFENNLKIISDLFIKIEFEYENEKRIKRREMPEPDRARLYAALNMAIKTHEGQKRRVSGLPYIVHPLEVLTKALEVTDNVDILIACLLHDGPEDRPKRLVNVINNEDISIVTDEDDLPQAVKIGSIIDAYGSLESEFGTNVAKIVFGVTKNVAEDDWRERARIYIKAVEFDAPDESSIVCAADKIRNISNQIEEYNNAKVKTAVYDNFHSNMHDQLWWFNANAEMLRRKSKQKDFMYKKELKTLVDQLEGLVIQFKGLVGLHDATRKVAGSAGPLACVSAAA